MIRDHGAGDGTSHERRGRADRKFPREYLVLRAVVVFGEEPPLSCGLMDISVGGAKLKVDGEAPPVGTKAYIVVESLAFRARGNVVRTYYTPTGMEVAVQFEEEQINMPSKLLQYKLRTHRTLGGRRHR